MHLRDELVDGQLDVEAGDRLELVERAAGVAEPAAAHLPERYAAGGDDRADGDRGLVADAAGRVLVDDLAAERCAEVERLAAADHRVGERVRLGGRQAAEVDGHAERGQLVVGDLARARSRGSARRCSSAASSSPFRFRSISSAGRIIALSATKTQWVERVWNGSVSSGTRSARCERVVVAATKSTHRAPRSGNDDRAVDVAPLDSREVAARALARRSRGRTTAPAVTSPPSEVPELPHVGVAESWRPRAGRRGAGRARARQPAVEVGHVVEHPARRRSRTTPSSNGSSWTSPSCASTPRARGQLDHPRRDVDAPRPRRRARREPLRELARAAADLEHTRSGVDLGAPPRRRASSGIDALRSASR